MNIFQVLPTMSFGDAVGNDTLTIDKALKKMGYHTKIYAENIDKRLSGVEKVEKLRAVKKEDVIIYHFSTGSSLNYKISTYPCKKTMIFHNVTPFEYFKSYNRILTNLCKEGWKGVEYLADKIDYCIADSEFNKRELEKCNYTCEIDVLPILINFDDYSKKPSNQVIQKYAEDGYVNILFTGRIAPNKKQENVIRTFHYYQTYINPKSRLFLVGSYQGMENYYQQLCEYVKELEVKNVVFTGHIPFDEILAYYRLADLFLCMSEHEGFCVPLVEAMFFDLPIIAYDTSAIGGTLGGAGILLKDNHPEIVGEFIHKLLTDESLKMKVLENQKLRLEDFSHNKILKDFQQNLTKLIEDKNE